MVQCIHFVSKLKLHIISKVLTHKKIIHLEFFKSHIIDLGFNNKTSYINHEYEIDSYVCLYVVVYQ
jgi:hypothetical protein